jgi:GNAT superfamily N-acetyltransferase
MPCLDIVRTSDVQRTARVMQVEGMFDLPSLPCSTERWSVHLDLPERWHIGVIVGPSGSGKTTVARELFNDHVVHGWSWPERHSILDGFPSSLRIKDITALLSSVGFSSPPSWLRPFHVLSNGEQFRVTMARTLAEMPSLAVVDEFTSVVDRTVAQIGSAAVAKTVRRRQQQLIAVTCHYDVLPWLEPDWIYEPATDTLSVGRSLQRPRLSLDVARVHSSAWTLFRKHHYLDASLHRSARCFCALLDGRPVAFVAILPFPHATRKNTRREHRIVCLPDFQGIGIGAALSQYAGAMCAALGMSYLGSTSHPAIIAHRSQSRHWKTIRAASFSEVGRTTGAIQAKTTVNKKDKKASAWKGVTTRLTASFEYCGPALSVEEASRVWYDGERAESLPS